MTESNLTQTTANEQEHKTFYTPDTMNGVIKLNSVQQMLFCISQSEDSAREMGSSTLSGVAAIMEESINEIEQDYNHLIDNESKYINRHRKLRAALAYYLESEHFLSKSEIAKILADDERAAQNS